MSRWRIKPEFNMGEYRRWYVMPPHPVLGAVYNSFWAPDLPTAFKWIELAITDGGGDG